MTTDEFNDLLKVKKIVYISVDDIRRIRRIMNELKIYDYDTLIWFLIRYYDLKKNTL